VEKTGFNAIFTAEGIQDKYHMIIVSGQGYASRSARQLLYELQKKGLTIYCLHDLDVYGVNILHRLRHGNDKANFDIDIVDLGVTPDDAARYGIVPEKVKNKNDTLPAEHREFFRVGADGYSRRVELNAFTTEQLLRILDDKLKDRNNLPRLEISAATQKNLTKIKEYALFQLVERKYRKMLNSLSIDEIEGLPETATYYELQNLLPTIEEKMVDGIIEKIEQEIERESA
jgi:DNA topoisomerase VI subunit A